MELEEIAEDRLAEEARLIEDAGDDVIPDWVDAYEC